MKTLIYRLSKNGFDSCLQDYHANALEQGLLNFKNNPNNYPEHLKDNINNSYNQVIPEWKEFTHGIFAFIGLLPEKETIRILTNHLNSKQKEEFVWWSAEIDIEQYAFDANNLWRTKGFKKIEDLVLGNYYEVFIPKQFLRVSNIQKWTNNYQSIYHQSEENLLLNFVKNEFTNKKRKIN